MQPQDQIALALAGIIDLAQTVSLQFPGGEDKIRQGLELIGQGFNEKMQMLGSPQQAAPSTPS
jgi:hypothetical protein